MTLAIFVGFLVNLISQCTLRIRSNCQILTIFLTVFLKNILIKLQML